MAITQVTYGYGCTENEHNNQVFQDIEIYEAMEKTQTNNQLNIFQ